MIVRVVPNPPAQRLGLVALRYPNGRIREESLAVLEGLRPGDQFDLYGRRWQAIGPAPLRRYERDSGRILCTPTGHTAPAFPSNSDVLANHDDNRLDAVTLTKR